MEIRSPKTPQEWEAYFDLRYRILRQPWNQPLGSERNDGDQTAAHFAVWIADKIAAVARMDETEKEDTVQVRFVAVDSSFQGKGLGKIIMQEVEKIAKQQGKKCIVLHARENALEFYRSLDYVEVEKSYLLFDEIQHYLMEKEI